MACKLQHYISQHLQRGFTDGEGAKAPVWVYRADGKNFKTGTAGYGASNYFYSDLPQHPEDETVDQKVTQFEAIIHPWLTELREAEIGSLVDGERAGMLVTHLSVRTAFVRDSFGGAATEMFDAMGEMVGSGQLTTMLGIGTDKATELIMDAAREQVEKMIATTELRDMPQPVQDMVRALAQQMALKMASGGMNAQINEEGREFTKVFEDISSKMKPTMRDRIGKTLSTQPAPPKHVERLAELDWTLEPPEDDAGAILPDCVAVAREASGRVSAYMGTDYKQMVSVALPVSSDRVLIGRATGAPSFTNAELAAASHTAFIASRSTDELKELIPSIGSSPAVHLGDEQSGLIADLRSGRLYGA